MRRLLRLAPLLVLAGGAALRASQPPLSALGAVPAAVDGLVRPWELPASDPRFVSERRWAIELGDPLAAARDAVVRLRGERDPLATRTVEAAEAALWARLFAVPLAGDPASYGAWRAGEGGGDAAADALAERIRSIESVEVGGWVRPGPRPASFRVARWRGGAGASLAGAALTEEEVDALAAPLADAARRVLDAAVVADAAPLEEALVRAGLDPFVDRPEVDALAAKLAALAPSSARVRIGRVEAGDAAHLVAIHLVLGERRVTRVLAQMRLAGGSSIVTVEAESESEAEADGDGDDALEDDVVTILRALAGA